MVTGHQQMNQAGSEKKCSKSVSYECVLNNYNYDDASADQNIICENCKQGGWSAPANGKPSSNVGSVCNTKQVFGVAEVCSREAESQLQPVARNSFEQSLLQKAWLYIQSIINSHMSSCPRCNPRPSPENESPSESTTQFFQSATPLAVSYIASPCHRTRPTCSRTTSASHNVNPTGQRACIPCPRAPPPCPRVSPHCSRAPPPYPNAKSSKNDISSPKAKSAYPDAKSRLNSMPTSKTSIYHKDCTHSPFDSPSPNAKPPRSYLAMPPCPSCKSNLHHSVSKDSLSNSSYSNRQSLYPNTESACPNANPVCQNAKPVCPNAKVVCPNAKPVCSNAKPVCLNANPVSPNAKPTCPHSKIVCPNANPVSPNAKPVCPHSKIVCPNANPVSPNAKPICPHSKIVCPNANPVSPNAKPICPHSKIVCPNANPVSINAKPVCPNANPVSPNANPVSLNAKPVCPNANPVSPNANPVSPNAKPICPHSKIVCPNANPVSLNAKSSETSTYHKSFTDSLSDTPSPKAKSAYPDAKSRLNSRPTSKTSIYHKDCTHSPFDSPSPNDTPPRSYLAMPPYPSYKSNLHHSVSKDSLSNSSYSNRQSLYPSTESTCPNSNPICQNAKPVCPTAKVVCPNAKPVCSNATPVCPNANPVSANANPVSPNAKLVCPNAKPVCSNAKPVCPNANPVSPNANPVSPNAKPICPHSKTVCTNSKTSLYCSFSNESLPSSCKESLVELAKVYLEKLTSDHKAKCPICAKQCSFYSLETITSYLRGMLEQVWSYIKTPAEQKCCEFQRSQSIGSNTPTKSGILKLRGSTKSRCICAGKSKSKSKFEPEGQLRTITCPACFTRFSCPKPGCLNFAPDLIKHYDDDADECEERTFPDRRSEEEGTHEHKSSCTHDFMHKCQSSQPIFNLSNTSRWSPKSCAKPVFNQIKTPQSVKECKASVTGTTDKSSGSFYGYDALDLCGTIESSRPVENSNVYKEFICLSDEPTPELVLNLTMEQMDVSSRPKESNHSREFLDNCKKTSSPFSDLIRPTCEEEALCPNQSCSEGSRKSEAKHVDVIGEESGNMLKKQLSDKGSRS